MDHPTNLENIKAKLLRDSIIDHIPNHYIFWKDRNSVYLGCNTALATSVGLKSSDEIVGKTDFDLPTMKEESEFYRMIDKEVMDSGQPKLNIEEPQTLPDGTKRILSTSKVPLFDEKGNIYGVLAIYSDITQQKLVEQNLIEVNRRLEQAIQIKSEFIRNVSHDIRTPLSGIQQATQMLAEGKIPEKEIISYAHAAWEASKQLMDLFNQIIDVTKNEDFSFEDKVVKFDLYKLLEDLNNTYEIIARSKGIKLEIDYAKTIPRFLLGMNLRLHRVLMNLLGNALKFTEKGSVTLHVEKIKRTEDEVVLQFDVIDTGIGIPADKFETIFEKFTKLETSFQSQHIGYGLGLFVVKTYVEKMHGRVYVNSKQGEGTTFSCILPFKKSLLSKKQTPIVKSASTEKYIPNKLGEYCNVLLVEDDKLIQAISVAMLKSIGGYKVDLAKSGEKAIQLANKIHYDIIYMDIGLPGTSGIDTAKTILKNPENRTIFITALTAHADDEITKQCLQAGIRQVLLKPLTTEKIKQTHIVFSQWLKNKNL